MSPSLPASSSLRSRRRRTLRLSTASSLAIALAVSGIVSAGGGAAASTPSASLAPAADGSASGGAVIVVLKSQHSQLDLRNQGAERAAATRSDQAHVVAEIKAGKGTGVTQLVAPNAVAARMPATEVARLRRDPSVAEIVPDATVQLPQPAAAPAAPATEPAHGKAKTCPFNPAGPDRPLQEPEAVADIHASNGDPHAPDMANSIATGKGVIVANDGMNELAGNPNFQRPDGSHVVIDAPDYTADHSNDEDYGDASSIAAQGTVVYQYSKALPFSDVPANCTFVIKGSAPDASLVDLSQVDTPVLQLSQAIAGIDTAVSVEHADVISESFGSSSLPGSASGEMLAQADEAAVAAGVTVVESSGDSGDSGTVISAADDPAVIAAGAVDNFRLVALAHNYRSYVSNNMAALSSGGTAPTNKVVDLLAPGYFGGEAACAAGSGGCPPNYPTESMRGTSESAPLIAGAAADVIQAYRDTHRGASPSPALIKQILTSTATDLDVPADQQGAGLLNVYAAVQAARQLPGATTAKHGTHGRGDDAASLVASPSQLDLTGAGGSVSTQSMKLYNTSDAPTTVRGSYREIGPEHQIGRTVSENVSAPDSSLPIPPEGAKAADPIRFTVPHGLDRLDVDMIWPDPTNSNVICYALFDPRGRLAQLSYDDGVASRHTISDIQHAVVADPEPGRWTAKILWSGKDVDLALAPAAPGTYTGPLSFKVSGQHFDTRPATGPITIRPHSSVRIQLHVAMPSQPGDHPESVQFSTVGRHRPHATGHAGTVTSVPIARRTLVPSSGGSFRTLITSTVGRMIGQLNTFGVNVPAARSALDVTFHTADTSADNSYTFYLVDPSGTVVSKDTTPKTGTGPAAGTAELTAANPVAGTWQIDVELNLTVSGKEFIQTVYGDLLPPAT